MTKTVEELQKELAAAQANTIVPPTKVKDNRYKIVVDPKQVESWELAVIESGIIGDWQLLFSRYLHNGSGLVSPELEEIDHKPLRLFTDDERNLIMSSDAFAIVERQKLAPLKDMAKAFGDGAAAGFQL